VDEAELQRPIFVLGIDRSGTSMLSEVLSCWGAYAGKPELLCRADEGNLQGYWEYVPMQDFFIELLNGVGLSIWDPDFKLRIGEKADDPQIRQRALRVAIEMESPDGFWLWKEQNLIFALPFLRRVFPQAIYLITLRNPYDSALSYDKLRVPEALRGKVRLIGYSLLRWQHFMVAIFEQLKDYPSKLLVSYEALVSSPRQECARICSFLATEYGLADDGEARLQRMVQAIDPRLWRNDGKVSFGERQDVSAAQKQLFAYLTSRLDLDVRDFDAAQYPFPEWSREYCANMSVAQWLMVSL
jgi:hypothetical protein